MKLQRGNIFKSETEILINLLVTLLTQLNNNSTDHFDILHIRFQGYRKGYKLLAVIIFITVFHPYAGETVRRS